LFVHDKILPDLAASGGGKRRTAASYAKPHRTNHASLQQAHFDTTILSAMCYKVISGDGGTYQQLVNKAFHIKITAT